MYYHHTSRQTPIVRLFVISIALVTAGAVWWASIRDVHAYTADAFVMRVKTDNSGTSGTNQFTIPTQNVSGQSFNVDCEDDGIIDYSNRNANTTCTYATPGEYTVAITGNLRRIYFAGAGDSRKLLSVEQWGTAATWSTMQAAFYGASNMVINATDAPNLTTPTTMSFDQIFRGATSLVDNGGAMNTWNTSRVTNMRYAFNGASSFNSPIGNWDMGKVVNMQWTFGGATSFNQPIGNWNTENVTTMYSMFQNAANFNQNLNGWDTSKVTTMYMMFNGASRFNGQIGGWNTENVANMAGMFSAATDFNQPIGSWDTGNVTTMSQMFLNNHNFNQPIGTWDIGNVTTLHQLMFGNPSFNQDLGAWDISHGPIMTQMFGGGSPAQRPKLSVTNYDNTLMGWLTTAQNNITFVGGRSEYCAATAARAELVSRGWNITDGGRKCPSAEVVITAPTKLHSGPITNTTIMVTDGYNGQTISAANVTLAAGTTAGTSAFNCTQISAERVDCTISVTSSGNLVVRAVNSEGEIGMATESNYIVDTTPPTTNVSIDTETNGIHQPILTFISTDNIAVQRVDVIYTPDNGGPGIGTTTTISGATSPLSLMLDPDEVLLTSVHTVIVRTYDTAGNMSENELRFPPIITFTAPTTLSNAAITNATVTISSPAGNDIEDITLSGGTGATLGACTGAGGDMISPYAQPVTCAISSVSSTGTVLVRARDAVNGATGQNSQSFVIDTVLPNIVITAPQKAANHAIASTTVAVTDNYQVNVSNVAVTATNQTGSFSISNVQCTQVSSSQVDCTLQVEGTPGTGDIQVAVTDMAGNTTSSTEANYLIDTALPVIAITAPTKRSTGAITDMTVSVADDNGVAASDVYITTDNVVGSLAISNIVCTQTTALRVDCTLQVDSTEGMGDIIVSAEDIVGNVASSTETDVIIDATAPIITITAPDKEANSPITTVSVSVTDNLRVRAADVVITAANQTGGFAISNVACTQTSISQIDCTLQINGTEGTGSIAVAVQDVVNNANSATEPGFVIDTTPPTTYPMVLRSGSDSGVLGDGMTNIFEPTIVARCAELPSTLELFIDGVHQLDYTCTAIEDVEFALSELLADGEYEVSYISRDYLGNASAPVSFALTIDNTEPTAVIERAGDQQQITDINQARFVLRASKPIMDITAADIILSGTTTGKVSAVTRLSATEWRIDITDLTDGDVVMVGLRSGALIDMIGNIANTDISPAGAQSVTYTAPAIPAAPNTGFEKYALPAKFVALLAAIGIIVGGFRFAHSDSE